MPKVHDAESRHDLSKMTNAGHGRVLTVERDLFVEWLSMPPSERKPSTQKDLAGELGVTAQTLLNWKRDPRIVAKVRTKIHSVLALNDLSGIVESMKTIALNPEHRSSVSAAKLLIDLMARADDTLIEVPLADMSLSDLRGMVAELYDVIDEKDGAESPIVVKSA